MAVGAVSSSQMVAPAVVDAITATNAPRVVAMSLTLMMRSYAGFRGMAMRFGE